MKPSKFIRPGEHLSVAEIYRRQFGHSTTPVNYEIYMKTVLLRDPLIYVDYMSMPYRVYRRKTFYEKLVDKVGNKWYNKIKGDDVR